MALSSKRSGTACKIKEIEELSRALESVRSQGKKVVHCHGVFDLLHVGHIRHLEQAKGLGDVLVVTVTPNEFVNKGPGRPVFSEELRAEGIAALDSVDYVAVNRWPLAAETIRLLRPHYYVKGSEYKDEQKDRSEGIISEKAAVLEVGGQIAFTEDITFSSSGLINRHMSVFPTEVSDYLDSFSSRYSSDDVLKYLENASSLRVLVVGETIIDEYVYCETLGKSGKDPVLATRRTSSERFAGGIVPVANHVAAFSEQVGLLTFLGGGQSHEEFIRENSDSKIEKSFLYTSGESSTILKQRFVEIYPFQRLFETYLLDDEEGSPAESAALCQKLEELLPEYDLVIVADYGHGMLAPEAVEVLCSRAPFLAINTQINAGNRGFNTISKYGRADFVCISENEMRLEARSRLRDIRDIVEDISSRLSCDQMLITQGSGGCLCYRKNEGFTDVPAFAIDVVDRMGAGDTVLSVAALCAAQEAPMEVVGFIGNVAGAEAVATVGHRKSLQRVPFFRHIETLLK